MSLIGGPQRNKSTDVRPLFRNPTSSSNSAWTTAFGFRLGWLIKTNYRLNVTYESAKSTMPDKVFGSVRSNVRSLSSFVQALYSIVPSRGINGYVGGGLGYHHLSLSGKKLERGNSYDLAIRLTTGAEYRVATNWWLLLETGYQHVFVQEAQIDPTNFRIFFGLGYLRANH